MRIAPPENQMEILYKEINSINKLLPSNLYIPFLSNTIRNYIIVHIPVSETRIFRTKNRAPYMLTVELIRIDELIL
jgi:phosphatidylinositol 4-kinase